MISFLILATCFLAYSNGANDNFKGVASLFGSRTCGYRTAISWATLTTGAVSFARGLNDTPKIAALLLVAAALKIEWGLVAVAVAMATGGLLNAHPARVSPRTLPRRCWLILPVITASR